MQDSEDYLRKKAFFDSLLTIYGRKPVLEALQDESIPAYKLHLAQSNRDDSVVRAIRDAADKRNIEINLCDRKALSRISRNAKQDQGVALDLALPHYGTADSFLNSLPASFELLALDGITNPQNLGMIIRSACAGGIDGILLPQKGCAQVDPLVIKSSVGTVFKTRILRCKTLHDTLARFREAGTEVIGLSSHAKRTLSDIGGSGCRIFVLGNETHGVSDAVSRISDSSVRIPMQNQVESLNVAVTAALIAFRKQL
ncbi:TrmH family RNA methyltransferase [Biformimicrobium ophioploci]|uniref:RNA methyltransferase n=1 Tax=Biformimicrobium ophioploci TaxID=3036711 RepID=A0ABQ6LZK6_9GAMM|nr:RNA methyltransferase [Microbulbifer sp. NKW57]GMG87477.1 RNA methyltransferase [Microbulbifer sp. NKW57]